MSTTEPNKTMTLADARGWAIGLSSQLEDCIVALDSIALDHGAPDRLIRIARRAAADARMKVEQARAALYPGQKGGV